MESSVIEVLLRMKSKATFTAWPRLEIDVDDVKPTLKVLSLNQGCRVNFSTLGRALGISHPTLRGRIKTLVDNGIIRLLHPLPKDLLPEGQHRARPAAPVLFIREAALLLPILGIEDGADLPDSVLGDHIFAGFMLERIIAAERRIHPDSCYYYYGGYYSTPVDLMIVRFDVRIGLVFRLKYSLRGADWRCLKAARKNDLISRGFALYAGLRGYSGVRDILTVNGLYFLEDYDFLTDLAQKRCPLLMRVARNNRKYPADMLRASEYPRHANRLLY